MLNEKTHDMRGNQVDGWYWQLLEESFQKFATAFRGAGNDRAAEIADRLAATTDDVPAELVQEQQDFWNNAGDDADAPIGSKEYSERWEAEIAKLEDIDDRMKEEIARGEFTPDNATVFVMEFIRRVSGIRMS